MAWAYADLRVRRPFQAAPELFSGPFALWVHEYIGDHRDTINRFEGAPQVAFPIRGVYLGDAFGILGCGVNCHSTQWLTVRLYDDFYLAERATAPTGSAQVPIVR